MLCDYLAGCHSCSVGGTDTDSAVPWPRSIALALKFQLCTMLRAAEFLSGKPDELVGLGTNDAEFHVPAQRVKARRVITQPLSSLAQEVLAEAIKTDDQPFIFPSPTGKAPHPRALGVAANGKLPYRLKSGREVGGITGICEFLGMAKWTPHTLRRTLCAAPARILGHRTHLFLAEEVYAWQQTLPIDTSLHDKIARIRRR